MRYSTCTALQALLAGTTSCQGADTRNTRGMESSRSPAKSSEENQAAPFFESKRGRSEFTKPELLVVDIGGFVQILEDDDSHPREE